MDEFASRIEALEHRWMRSWMHRDRNQMKSLAVRDFIFLLGSTKAAILDRASWLEAATTRFRCIGYRFDEVYVRRHGGVAVFATQMKLEAKVDGYDWSGPTWVMDLWQRSSVKRQWRIVERTLSRPDEDAKMTEAIRSMQLWR
ncbi:nuclear transport factor 2 family protein [Qipengyuania spongiae]|uniref:Nuclear transport factor 2 family protein n=1 Tax=Qipengyuania spongiae TaxID=2909673 RepID=A0ABY5SXL8_9SPHN|nr:nuclear transport factor 2 family protein [Qipengyuania spongiae]UVI38969.1 nuclear transport factor 2 family protein [Qipengyuania spongiae]